MSTLYLNAAMIPHPQNGRGVIRIERLSEICESSTFKVTDSGIISMAETSQELKSHHGEHVDALHRAEHELAERGSASSGLDTKVFDTPPQSANYTIISPTTRPIQVKRTPQAQARGLCLSFIKLTWPYTTP